MTGWRKRGGGVMSDGGKGSGRRNEDVSKINSNWDQIDWSVKKNMEHDEYEHDDDDEGFDCPMCGGQFKANSMGNYLYCDGCGHRQELTDDDDYT